MVAMSLVYAAFAYPAGRARRPRACDRRCCRPALAALVASDIVLALAGGAAGALAGAALWGLHMALTQGLLAALVAATAPADLRGTAFGVFNLASGVALLVASALAGYLWQAIGPAATFVRRRRLHGRSPGSRFIVHAPRVPRLDGEPLNARPGRTRRKPGVSFRVERRLSSGRRQALAAARRRRRRCAAARCEDPSTMNDHSQSRHSRSRPAPSVGPAAPSRPLYLRHALAVRIMHWINVVALTLMLHERAADLQRASGAVLGRFVVQRAAGVARNRREGRRAGQRRSATRACSDTNSRPPACSDCRPTTAGMYAQGFPSWLTVPSHQWLAMARSWHFFFAWMFLINGLCYVAYTICEPPPRARPAADARRPSRHRRVDRRSPALPASDRRGGEALQRAAEVRLPHRHLRAAAADRPDGPRHVAAARYAVRRLGRLVRRPADRCARSISSSRGCSSRSC